MADLPHHAWPAGAPSLLSRRIVPGFVGPVGPVWPARPATAHSRPAPRRRCLPTPGRRPNPGHPSVAASNSNQWDLLSNPQFAPQPPPDDDPAHSSASPRQPEPASPVEQRPTVHDIHNTAVHTHLHVQLQALPIFRRAARRYLQASRCDSGTAPQQKQKQQQQPVSILQLIPHPGFGTVEPAPIRRPRFVVAQNSTSPSEATLRWISGLEKTGIVLSPTVPPYTVEYRVVLEVGPLDLSKAPPGCVLATEMINTKSAADIVAMQKIITDHAEAVVADGAALKYQVLQAMGQPAFFKTMEVYRSATHLAEYMAERDAQFEAACLPWRAAVNRVRQSYSPISDDA